MNYGWRRLVGLLFPVRCVVCGNKGSYLCDGCERLVRFDPIQRCAMCNQRAIGGQTHRRCQKAWGLDGVWAACRYEGEVKKLLRKFKYGYVRDLKDKLAELILDQLPADLRSYDLVVPIPLYKTRERWRGFNQAELIGMEVGKKLGVAVNKEMLERNHYHGPQARVRHRSERLKNMGKEAFRIGSEQKLKGAMILLIDDIVTTGATLRAAAQVLKRAGAEKVWGVVVAR